MSGLVSYIGGKLAEASVRGSYIEAGYRLLAQRWAGAGGEIDLIFEGQGEIVFVEVKSSRSFDRAAEALRPRQIRRLLRAAEEALDYFPRQSLTPMRFDVALVDGTGRIERVENALAA